jgi:SAM-dependent methyltransferase
LRERAARRNGGAFLFEHIADELAERLALVSRDFRNALFIGPIGAMANRMMGDRNCSVSVSDAEEDQLPFDPASFDLVISAGTLDSVNDLPGALVQIRRTLKPDGLFLGHMFGAGSLATLKSAIMAAEGPVAAPHIHPQIELRSAADLLSRAGFALPVADLDMMRVRYGHWRSIVTDTRDAGIGNALAGPRHYPGSDIFARLDAEWRRRADEAGKVEEVFAHLFVSGWAPSPDQPKPAKRGSGVSLASILPSREIS